jgi:hypothetical protein
VNSEIIDASHPPADVSADAATQADAPNTCPLPPVAVDADTSRAPCTGEIADAGACLITLATGQDRPSGLAVRGDTIVWANSPVGLNQASIVRSSTNGGTPVTLASKIYTSLAEEVSITLDDTNVYFVESQQLYGLFAISTAGTGFTQLPMPQFAEPASVAGSSTGIVYTWESDEEGTPGGLGSMPCGGSPVTLYTEPSGMMGEVASGGDVVVFVQGARGVGALMAIPLEGGTARVLAPRIYADSLATDGVDVYWTDGNQRALMKLNLASGQPQALAPYWGLPAGLFGERALALDATSAYFTSMGGSIMKLTPR